MRIARVGEGGEVRLRDERQQVPGRGEVLAIPGDRGGVRVVLVMVVHDVKHRDAGRAGRCFCVGEVSGHRDHGFHPRVVTAPFEGEGVCQHLAVGVPRDRDPIGVDEAGDRVPWRRRASQRLAEREVEVGDVRDPKVGVARPTGRVGVEQGDRRRDDDVSRRCPLAEQAGVLSRRGVEAMQRRPPEGRDDQRQPAARSGSVQHRAVPMPDRAPWSPSSASVHRVRFPSLV